MKKYLKILTYLFLGILGLIIFTCIGLLFYYQSIYKETPLSADVSNIPQNTKTMLTSDKPILLPVPKKMEWTTGHFTFTNPIKFSAPKEAVITINKIFQHHLHLTGIVNTSGTIKFIKTKELKPQAYHLQIQPAQIHIEYGDDQGLFYALTTLKQIAIQSNNLLPCVDIEDNPDLATRGAMLDISRGKIPTLETLYGIVDFLSDLKYNQLQLYIEGFSFGYPSFKSLWEKTETPLTPEEIRKLDAYCKDRFIELVPNQNSLGHMGPWLATDQYKDLAECPEGYKLLGLIDIKTTLSPTNPKSLELIKKMSNDLLPNFQSNQFNVNLDEPFELGKNKNHPIKAPKEITKIYINYAIQLNDYVNSKGKKMMMWGDVVSKSPEIIPTIPKNITLLEWRYEADQPFNKICAKYQNAGLHYMVCPGTSSWSSFTGRTDNMMRNVENAISSGIQFGAAGILMTDWGDTPHLQYLTVSYAGFAYAAALSWNFDSKSRLALGNYLSKAVFNDSKGMMGNLVMELGRYNQFEEYPMLSMTTTSMSYLFGIMDKTILDAINKKMQRGIFELLPFEDELKTTLINRFNNPKVYNAKAIIHFVDNLEKELLQTDMHRQDNALILAEYKNAIRMIRLGAELKQYNNYHLQQSDKENKHLLLEMKLLCSTIMSEHERLWKHRNKLSSLDQSMSSFKKLQVQINEALDLMYKNTFTRLIYRSIEKIKSATAVLYLK